MFIRNHVSLNMLSLGWATLGNRGCPARGRAFRPKSRPAAPSATEPLCGRDWVVETKIPLAGLASVLNLPQPWPMHPPHRLRQRGGSNGHRWRQRSSAVRTDSTGGKRSRCRANRLVSRPLKLVLPSGLKFTLRYDLPAPATKTERLAQARELVHAAGQLARRRAGARLDGPARACRD